MTGNTANTAIQNKRELSPMLRQYLEYKEAYSDCLLFFQVGDFYEAFFDDAVQLARLLNVTLTSRDKNIADPVPMAGVPVAVVEGYLERLVVAGQSVALVSQYEIPGQKGSVGRRLDRILTPGIKLSAPAVADEQEALIGALFLSSDPQSWFSGTLEYALAYAAVQSGRIQVRAGISPAALADDLARCAFSELILPRVLDSKQVDGRAKWVQEIAARNPRCAIKFRALAAAALSGQRDANLLPGYQSLSPNSKKAARLLINYIDEVMVAATLPLTVTAEAPETPLLLMDANTRLNLELVCNARSGGIEGSLLWIVDHCSTLPGRRRLRQWLLQPLTDRGAIARRQAVVAVLVAQPEWREEISRLLRYMVDLERIAARLELRLLTPRELGALRDALLKLPELKEQLAQAAAAGAELALLHDLNTAIAVNPSMSERLQAALVEQPPPNCREGGIFARGYNQELDRLRGLKEEGQQFLQDLEKRERERSGIASLKVKYNNVQGYFIEVTRANLNRVPGDYIRKQTMVNAERFVTEELKVFETELLSSQARQWALEQKLFEELREAVLPESPALRQAAESLAQLDVLGALAEAAEREAWSRPLLCADNTLKIEQGRHPVAARLLQGAFVPNSLHFTGDEQSCFIITGANMGGKSTYLRQTALIVILAQIGSYVPARRAEIGIVDQIFARIGAADDLMEGESTFMLEMREAALILAKATQRSLLLIDEIGRGTATGDGLAIAQAILEWVVQRLRCRTLFATHFHELTLLAEAYPGVLNFSVASIERDGTVIFTHEIRPGAADCSYGIEVATWAGLPAPVIARARVLLDQLEANDVKRQTVAGGSRASQLSIFDEAGSGGDGAAPRAWRWEADYRELKSWRERLAALSLDELSPLEALNLLFTIQAELKQQKALLSPGATVCVGQD